MIRYEIAQKFALAIMARGTSYTDLIREARRLNLVYLDVLRSNVSYNYLKRIADGWAHLSGSTLLVLIQGNGHSIVAENFAQVLQLYKLLFTFRSDLLPLISYAGHPL